MFVLKHQDGNINYALNKAGYAILDSKLYLSIETEAIDDEAFPDCFLFAVNGYPIDSSAKKFKIKVSTNPNDTPPNVHVYTTFHALEVIAEIDLNFVSNSKIETSINIISDNVSYYNKNAPTNSFQGKVELDKKDKNELWIP